MSLNDFQNGIIFGASAGQIFNKDVQSDYNQNNEKAPEYIKNRPFFEQRDKIKLDTHVDEWDYQVIEDDSHNFVLSVEFKNVNVDIELYKLYVVKITIFRESTQEEMILPASCTGMINSTYAILTENNSVSILVNGMPVKDLLTNFFNIESRNNVISVMFTGDPSELAKIKGISLSLCEENTSGEVEYLNFNYIKPIDNKFLRDKFRYLNYTGDYFKVDAKQDDNMVTVEIGVPVGFYNTDVGTINYTVKDGIRVGDFHFASLQSILVDMFPKNQEWDIWTLNSIENGGIKATPATILLVQLTTVEVKSHVKYCTELYKTYLFQDEHNPLGNLWAGLRWIIVFDDNEIAQSFANNINESVGITSITVRLRDIDYVEENIVPLIVPDTNESEGDS